MLTLVVPETELFDEVRNEIIFVKEQKLTLEHSLLSLSKWESKWHKPFLSRTKKTKEETLDYFRCMTINSVDEYAYDCLTPEMVTRINDYIEDSMTATTFSDKKTPNREIITAELIYYWMVALNIPFECQKWHLNRLLTLVNVCSIKNQPPKNMSESEILRENARLNALRRKALHSKG